VLLFPLYDLFALSASSACFVSETLQRSHGSICRVSLRLHAVERPAAVNQLLVVAVPMLYRCYEQKPPMMGSASSASYV
jgi:hypothetical protein